MLYEIQPSQWFDSGGNPLTALGNLRIEGTDVVLEGQMDSTGIVSQFGRFVMPLTRVGDVLQWALLALLEAGRGYLEVRAVAAGPTNTALAVGLPLGPETWVKSDVRTVDIVPEQSYVSILGGTPGENVILRIKRLLLGDPQSIEMATTPAAFAPVGERLAAPFAATRRYGLNPLAVGFDILTFPFQISNVLTGQPQITVPVLPTTLVVPLPPTFRFPGVELTRGEEMRNIEVTFRAIGGIPTGKQGSHVGFPLGATGTGLQITASFTYQGPGTPISLSAVSDQAPSDVRSTPVTLPLSPSPTPQTVTVLLPLSAATQVVHTVTATLSALDPAGAIRKTVGSGQHSYPVFIPESFGSPSVSFLPMTTSVPHGTANVSADANASLLYTGPGARVTFTLTDTLTGTSNIVAADIPSSPTSRSLLLPNSLLINTARAGLHKVTALLTRPDGTPLASAVLNLDVYYPEVFGPVTFGF